MNDFRAKYNPETIEDICSNLRRHSGRVKAAEAAGIHYDTFLEWLKDAKKPEFSDAVKAAERYARESGKTFAVQAIFKAMPDSWQAAAWWLERNHKQFVKKERLDQHQTGNINNAVQIEFINSNKPSQESIKAPEKIIEFLPEIELHPIKHKNEQDKSK